jgi:hypothetical protein
MGPMKAVYTIVDITSAVYSFMLFDIAGDRIGGFRAFCLFTIPTLALPLLLRLFYRSVYPLLADKTRRATGGRQKSGSHAEDIQVETIEAVFSDLSVTTAAARGAGAREAGSGSSLSLNGRSSLASGGSSLTRDSKGGSSLELTDRGSLSNSHLEPGDNL